MARSNYRSFFVFLAFVAGAAVLWFLFRYNDTYEEYVEMNVNWSNVPADIELEDNSKNVIVPVKVRASGFELLSFNYKDLTTTLDFQEFTTSSSDGIVFQPENARGLIDRTLGMAIKIMEVDTAPVPINFERFKSKTVPLVRDFKLEFEGNYNELGNSSFTVDEVLVTGNDNLIEPLTVLPIRLDKIKIGDTLVRKEIILRDLYPDLRFEPETVAFEIRAAQMTEGSFKLPITLKNKLQNTKVQVIPDILTVVYSCRLSDFDQIKKSDFKVLVDAGNIEAGESTIIPEILYENPMVNEARVQPQSVQVLVIQ